MSTLAELQRGGLRAELEPTGALRVRGTLTDSWRAWIREHRDALVAELRVAGQDGAGQRALLTGMVEDLAAVDAHRADRLQDHVEQLLRTAPDAARKEIARCWASLVACQLPEVPETTPWRWLVVRSGLLGESFLLVESKDDVDDARRAFPDLVSWIVGEALELVEQDATDEAVHAVHRVKRTFGGHVLRRGVVPDMEPWEMGVQERHGGHDSWTANPRAESAQYAEYAEQPDSAGDRGDRKTGGERG